MIYSKFQSKTAMKSTTFITRGRMVPEQKETKVKEDGTGLWRDPNRPSVQKVWSSRSRVG